MWLHFSQVMNFARWMATGAMELCHLRSRSHAMPCVFISGRATQGNSVLQRSTWRYKTTEQSTSFWPGVRTHLYNIEDSTRKDTLGRFASDIALRGDETHIGEQTSCLAFLFFRLDASWVLNCSYTMKMGQWWHHFINIRGQLNFWRNSWKQAANYLQMFRVVDAKNTLIIKIPFSNHL